MLPHEGVLIVTGSNNGIGQKVVRRLSGKYRVVALDSEKPSQPVLTAEYYCVDVDMGRPEASAPVFRDVRERFGSRMISFVHMGQRPGAYLQVAREAGFEVEQFVFASTLKVHMPGGPDRRIAETSPLSPTGPLTQAFLEGEAHILETHRDTSTVILRFADVYDDYGNYEPLAREIQAILEWKSSARDLPKGLSGYHALVHVEDAVDAISRAVDRRTLLPAETILLIGEPKLVSFADIQDRIGTLIHGEAWRAPRLPGLSNEYCLDISEAKRLLGWEPIRSIYNILPRVVSLLKSGPERGVSSQGNGARVKFG